MPQFAQVVVVDAELAAADQVRQVQAGPGGLVHLDVDDTAGDADELRRPVIGVVDGHQDLTGHGFK